MMFPDTDVIIRKNRRGYYTLTVGGAFQGNFDTFSEAYREAVEISQMAEAAKA